MCGSEGGKEDRMWNIFKPIFEKTIPILNNPYELQETEKVHDDNDYQPIVEWLLWWKEHHFHTESGPESHDTTYFQRPQCCGWAQLIR